MKRLLVASFVSLSAVVAFAAPAQAAGAMPNPAPPATDNEVSCAALTAALEAHFPPAFASDTPAAQTLINMDRIFCSG